MSQNTPVDQGNTSQPAGASVPPNPSAIAVPNASTPTSAPTIKNWGQSTTTKTPPAPVPTPAPAPKPRQTTQKTPSPSQTVNHSAYRQKTQPPAATQGENRQTTPAPKTTTYTHQQKQQGPNKMEMWLDDASKAKAKPVAFSDRIKGTLKHLANNPEDFLISIATSMATFVAVKAIFVVGLGVASPLLAGVLAAGAIGMYRANQQAKKQAGEKIRAMQAQGIKPTPEDLAAAQKVSSGAILNAGLRHALFSGLIGAFLGNLVPIEPVREALGIESSSLPTEAEYAEYKEDLLEQMPKEYYHYTETGNTTVDGADVTDGVPLMTVEEGKIGAYQFDEATLAKYGIYEAASTPDSGEWQGEWTGEMPEGFEGEAVSSMYEFLHSKNTSLQDYIAMQELSERLPQHWEFMEKHDLINGVDVNEQTVNPAQVMAGIERYGDTEFSEYLKTGEPPADLKVETGTSLGDTELKKAVIEDMHGYLGHFSDDKLPFIAGSTTGEMQFAVEKNPLETMGAAMTGFEAWVENLFSFDWLLGDSSTPEAPATDVGDGHDHSDKTGADTDSTKVQDSTAQDTSYADTINQERAAAEEAQKKTSPAMRQ